MKAVIRNCFLWTCQAIGLSTNTGTYVGDAFGSNVIQSGMQWLKLQIDNNSLVLAEHGRVFDTNQTDKPIWYYMPSLMVNCPGDMVGGFSGSGLTNYISGYYSWRLSDGAVPDKPRLLQPGTVQFAGNRWGDYSAASLDPVDDWGFWTVQQYAATVEFTPGLFQNRWSTAIGKLRPNP